LTYYIWGINKVIVEEFDNVEGAADFLNVAKHKINQYLNKRKLVRSRYFVTSRKNFDWKAAGEEEFGNRYGD